MKKTIILVFFLIAFSHLYSKNDITMWFDYAAFRNDENLVKWEFYYGLPDTTFTYVVDSTKYNGEIYMSITISTNLDTVDFKEWVCSNFKTTYTGNIVNDLVGQKDFYLKPGQYKVDIYARDLNDTLKTLSNSININLYKYPQDKLGLSNLEMINAIEPEKSPSKAWSGNFKKNSLFVVPNPTASFFSLTPEIKAYLEIYNAKTLSSKGLNIHYHVYNAIREEVLSYSRKQESVSDGLIEKIIIPAEALPTGYYYLRIIVAPIENPSLDSVYSEKKFVILNPDMPPVQLANFTENESFVRSEFSTMTLEQIEREYAQAKIIANEDEKDEYPKLTTLEAKQRFIFRFWRGRNLDTNDLVNSKLQKYREAIKYADIYFKYGILKDGWKTDRGRILLKYGFPTSKDFTAANNEYRAYETWFYGEIQGGVYFYFVDVGGFGNFTLVNSTANGEHRDENWYSKYVVSHNSDDYKQQLNGGR